MIKLKVCASDAQEELVFVPLGGIGEIGMNLSLYGYGTPQNRKWIMIDAGISFPDDQHPGVDFIFPDIGFVEKNRTHLEGIIITHAHEDHYGALHALWPRLKVPVWMTPFAEGLFVARGRFEKESLEIPIISYKAREEFKVGSFSIEAIPVAHSIPESMALALKTPAGVVIHTGDWRIDKSPEILVKTDEKRFKSLGDQGVLALMCDSTNSLEKGKTVSEKILAESLEKIMKESRGRVIIGMFSSNLGRVLSIAKAAKEIGRHVVVLGRSLRRVVDVAEELGYLKDIPDFKEAECLKSIPHDKIVIICTGSQGEERAVLAKLSRDEIKNLPLTSRDTIVFSSRTIPGNEKAISRIKNRFIDMGVRIVESNEALIHVSGHACTDELRNMYAWTRPHISVPIHGEPRHLAAQASLMKESGIKNVMQVRNGDMLRLYPGKPDVIEQVPWGHMYKDGLFIGDDKSMCVHERRKLSVAGHIVVIAFLEGCSVEDLEIILAGVPNVHIKGILDQGDEKFIPGVNALEDVLKESIIEAIQEIPAKHHYNLTFIQNTIVRATTQEAKRLWGKKPLVSVYMS